MTSSPSVRIEIVGVVPITRNEFGRKRPSYLSWVEAIRAAGGESRRTAEQLPEGPFSLTVELRTYSPWDQGSDLDNYIKDIQDVLADAGLFGKATPGNPMKGDEHIDHLEIRRHRVGTTAEAGASVTIESLTPETLDA